MKNFLLAGTALTLVAGAANAGGIDRSRAPYSILFEEGSYAQLSFSVANPDVSGDYVAALGGGSTDNMAEGFVSVGLAYKQDVGNGVSLAFTLSEPYGANASYTAGLYTGLAADWESRQIALLAKYQADDNISVYGGLRYVRSSADIAIPDALIRGGAAAAGSALATAPAGTLNYGAQGAADSQWGYVFGAAYERKDIALRVSLTYESQIDHSFDTAEQLVAVGALPNGDTEVSLPQSITLDFQSGVAADTLVFGSIRWTEWSVFDVAPPFYGSNFGSVVAFDNDTTTYQIGVGRRLNPDFSVFARLGYERSNGGVASRLAPTDGSTSIGFGGSYTMDNVEFTGGLEYAVLGDAVDGSGTDYSDNDVLGLGVTIGFSF